MCIRDRPSGVLIVEGKEQIHLERGDEDLQLLLTIDVYNDVGNHAAKLRRNAWAFNDGERYEISTQPAALKLFESITGKVVLEANVIDRDTVVVADGDFYTPGRDRIEITPEYLRIRGITMSSNYIDCRGRALRLEQGSLAIG